MRQQHQEKKKSSTPNSFVVLKKGKEKAILAKHHWIFSGAIASMPHFDDGDMLPVHSSEGSFLGWGYFNKQTSIRGRMVSFDQTPPWTAIQLHLKQAIEMRQKLFPTDYTNAYRVVNGEGDCLPGLIVDKYADVLVFQISTRGMEKLKGDLIAELDSLFNPTAIYEKSTSSARKEEGLNNIQKIHKGSLEPYTIIEENGLKFQVSIQEGQKTGFFLDHRDMRQQVKTLAYDRDVLNAFAYTGGFSVYAASGGAKRVDSVDISEKAIQDAKLNMALNGFSDGKQRFFVADVFQFLREYPLDYNLVILDPPAFAKRKKDLIPACRGYKDINRLAIQKMPAKSLLLTSSCSYFVDQDLFQKVIFQATVESGRTVKIIGRHQLAADHPVNVCHPEGDYLKSLLLYIE